MSTVEHDPHAQRFSLEADGELAVLDYTLTGEVMTITHTGVPEAIGGRGLAAQLTRAALAQARQRRWKVIAACSYAAAYLEKHPEENPR
jgi:predicted GNAT family acetyltransferase